METLELLKIIENVLDERKALNILELDVKDKTSITDYMVIATGTSSRHIVSLGGYIQEKLKELGDNPLGVEGGQGSDWVLLDLGQVIVHLMTQSARDYYQLEKLWSVPLSQSA
jgi:ribosome-associated protein